MGRHQQFYLLFCLGLVGNTSHLTASHKDARMPLILINSDSFPAQAVVTTATGSETFQLPPFGKEHVVMTIPLTAQLLLKSATLGSLQLPAASLLPGYACLTLHAAANPKKPGTFMLAVKACAS